MKRALQMGFSLALVFGLPEIRGGAGGTVAWAAPGPTIGPITVQTPGNVERYARFEISFPVTTTATNPYFPYNAAPPPGIAPNIGITVNALLFPPGQASPKVLPCFYYQPVEEVGSGANVALLPTGSPEWRCRYSPETVGTWQYQIQATDSGGTTEGPVAQFSVIASARKGFIRNSQADRRFFEFSDGTPFVTPLLNTNPGASSRLYDLRNGIAQMGQNGIHFIRWFPTGEGGTIAIPYGDDIKSSWGFGPTWFKADDVDSASGNKFSFAPYYYTYQTVAAVPGARYRLSFRASLTGERVLQAELQGVPDARLDICSTTNTQHTGCQVKQDGWHSYEITGINSNDLPAITIWLHGLYVHSDAPSPYDSVRTGTIRISSIVLQRDETGNGGWGNNLVSRGDPDTYRYFDQIEAARLDEIFRLSEQYELYHKVTLFHKNDQILNVFDEQGNVTEFVQCSWGYCPDHFYSGDGQMVRWLEHAYMRYFIGRWSYSPAIHSVEFVNESDLYDLALSANFDYAQYIKNITPRPLLVSTSFWGYLNEGIWTDATYGQYLDYADKHWYADHRDVDCATDPDGCEVISSIWDDSAANVRQCYLRFRSFATSSYNYQKPILRGETGVGSSGTQPQDCGIVQDATGTYYHKKVWANLGSVGYTCDGEWYPWLFGNNHECSGVTFPNTTDSVFAMYAAYDAFVADEPLNNGSHVEIGTDLSGDNRITTSNATLRAFGSKDPATARVLVWVDNKNNTWPNAGYSTDATSTFSISGMPAGSYTRELWDTRAGTYIETSGAVNVADDGILQFSATTSKDVAFKFYIPGVIPPPPQQTFADVPPSDPYYDEIEALYEAGYTAGCSIDPLIYCPENTMNRAESAVFVERGIHGTDGLPPQPTTQTFADLPLDSWAAKWAEALWQDGYTAGCGTDPLIYCPWQGHTRAEGCVFYLHMLNGAAYEPPQPSQQAFADVPLETWYAKWVQAAYDAGLLEPCLTSPELRFCPNDPLSRALAAYMMVQAKGLLP